MGSSKPTKKAKAKSSTAGKRRVSFEMTADSGSHVAVAGSFNGWQPTSHVLSEIKPGHFKRTMYLAPGRYEYKFIVGEEWVADPENSEWNRNEFGSLNSVLTVE